MILSEFVVEIFWWNSSLLLERMLNMDTLCLRTWCLRSLGNLRTCQGECRGAHHWDVFASLAGAAILFDLHPFLSLSHYLGRIPPIFIFIFSERVLNGKTLCLRTLGNLRTCQGQCGETMWMFLQALHIWQFFPLFAKHCAFELDVIFSWWFKSLPTAIPNQPHRSFLSLWTTSFG